MLREMTNKRIETNRSAFGAKFLHVGGGYYKAAIILSYITVIYNLVMFLVQFFGALEKASGSNISEGYKLNWQLNMRTSIILVFILIIAFIMLFIKKHLIYSIFSISSGIFYFVTAEFSSVLTSKKEIATLWIYLPAVILMVACAAYIIATTIIDYLEYKRAYAKLVDKIVATYPTKEGEITTEAQWESYIEQYNEPTVHAKPKKSLRNKKRKDAAEVNDD